MFVHNKKTIVNLDHIIGIDKDEDAGFKLTFKNGWYTWKYDTRSERDEAFDKIKDEVNSKEI